MLNCRSPPMMAGVPWPIAAAFATAEVKLDAAQDLKVVQSAHASAAREGKVVTDIGAESDARAIAIFDTATEGKVKSAGVQRTRGVADDQDIGQTTTNRQE